MILAHLIGGLGNQMFQYACARRLAHGLRAELKLDLSAFESYRLHNYALNGLGISAAVATANELRAFRRRAHRSGRLPQWLLEAVPGWRYEVFQERSFAFDPGVLELRGNVLLEGYWQSERYFRDIGDIVRREFVLKADMSASSASVAARILGTSAVSVHVRRKDYVSNPETRRIHGGCDLDYYQRAAEIIARTEPQPHFFLFSDDLEWTRRNLRLGFPIFLVESAGAEVACEDLQLMSLCRHHIIANSSFSWWGAWLNPKPDKKVIAPLEWFNEASHDTRDLIPTEWIRI